MKCLKQINGLRQAITRGDVQVGEMVGTEFAFSQEWGLARNTVRRGIDTLIREGLLERRPGKGLFVRSTPSTTRTIQVVVPNLAWGWHVKIVRGVQEAGREHGIQTQVYDAHGQMELDLNAVRRLADGPFDGAVIVSLHDRRFSEALYELKSAEYPFVLVDQRLHDLEVSTLEADNYGGGYAVGKELAALGHERVAFLGPMDIQVVSDRLSGFRDAMLDARVLFDRSLVIDLGGSGLTEWMNDKAHQTEEAVLPLLTRKNRPTAIFDGSGDVAPIIYRAVKRAGLRIPQDISVVTFEDSPYTEFLEPEVARLRHAWTDMGRAAFEMLVEQMDAVESGDERPTHRHRVMSVGWEAGASLAPPAAMSGA